MSATTTAPQLMIKGKPIDYALANLLGEKASDFLVLYLNGQQLEGFGTPLDTPGNRELWDALVAKLNEDELYWFRFFINWGPQLAAQFGSAGAEDFRPHASYRIHRVVAGYSQHLHCAIRLFEHPKVLERVRSFSVSAYTENAALKYSCSIDPKQGPSVWRGRRGTLAEVVSDAVLQLLQRDSPGQPEGGRLPEQRNAK